jgi:hypothetical protein
MLLKNYRVVAPQITTQGSEMMVSTDGLLGLLDLVEGFSELFLN